MQSFAPPVSTSVPPAGAPVFSEWTRTTRSGDGILATVAALSAHGGADFAKDVRFLVFGQTSACRLGHIRVFHSADIRPPSSVHCVASFPCQPTTKQGCSGIDHHVVTEVGAGWRQAVQFFGAVCTFACEADQHHFRRLESADVQCADHTPVRLLHPQDMPTGGAMRVDRSELQMRRFAEQTGRRHTSVQTVELFGKATYQGKCGFLLTVRPKRRKKFWMVSVSSKTFCFRRRRFNAS